MKKSIICIVIAIVCIATAVPCYAEMYPNCGIISKINRAQNIVYFTDFSGNVWGFYGVEDWEIGDIIAVIMDDMNTEIIYDDEIVKAVYCGVIG